MPEAPKFPLDADGQPIGITPYHRQRLESRTMEGLISLCKGVIADGRIVTEEVKVIQGWLDANKDFAGQWPAKVLTPRIEAVLADGRVDSDEERELMELLRELTGMNTKLGVYVKNSPSTLPLDKPPPIVIFKSRVFAITGRCASGPRKMIESAIAERGGRSKDHVTQETNYLILGEIGSEQWEVSTHGTKIRMAVEYRERGLPISIVSEEHLYWSLSQTT